MFSSLSSVERNRGHGPLRLAWLGNLPGENSRSKTFSPCRTEAWPLQTTGARPISEDSPYKSCKWVNHSEDSLDERLTRSYLSCRRFHPSVDRCVSAYSVLAISIRSRPTFVSCWAKASDKKEEALRRECEGLDSSCLCWFV